MRIIGRHCKISALTPITIILIAIIALVAPVNAGPSPAKAGVKMFHDVVKPGVTVTKDKTSPTGYMVTFVYEDSSAETVQFSGDFYFALPFENDPNNISYYSPDEWTKDMFWYMPNVPPYARDMVKIEDTDYWTTSMALPCGNFLYRYIVDGEAITDPVNPPIITQYEKVDPNLNYSTAYVPFDEKKQLYDMSFALPRKGRKTGTVFSVTYSIGGLLGADNETQGLCIYLPFGYDANRSKPYPVLYLSHGGGGNEAHWFSWANAQNIMDNLIADREIEPTIVVTMNNSVFIGVNGMDMEKLMENQMENIIPYIEESYNVSADPKDRAYAGLSMGGMITSHMLICHPKDFGYFGVLAGSDANLDNYDCIDDDTWNDMRKARIFLGTAIYDFAYYDYYNGDPGIWTIPSMQNLLSLNFVPYDYLIVNAGHDWSSWRQLLYKFAKDILWD